MLEWALGNDDEFKPLLHFDELPHLLPTTACYPFADAFLANEDNDHVEKAYKEFKKDEKEILVPMCTTGETKYRYDEMLRIHSGLLKFVVVSNSSVLNPVPGSSVVRLDFSSWKKIFARSSSKALIMAFLATMLRAYLKTVLQTPDSSPEVVASAKRALSFQDYEDMTRARARLTEPVVDLEVTLKELEVEQAKLKIKLLALEVEQVKKSNALNVLLLKKQCMDAGIPQDLVDDTIENM